MVKRIFSKMLGVTAFCTMFSWAVVAIGCAGETEKTITYQQDTKTLTVDFSAFQSKTEADLEGFTHEWFDGGTLTVYPQYKEQDIERVVICADYKNSEEGQTVNSVFENLSVAFDSTWSSNIYIELDGVAFCAPSGKNALDLSRVNSEQIEVKVTGSVYLKGGMGTQTKPNGSAAIYAKTQLSVTGNGDLTVYGGAGAQGADGTDGSVGGTGGNGTQGGSGGTAIVASGSVLKVSVAGGVVAYGGNGGNGGMGGIGGIGQEGSGYAIPSDNGPTVSRGSQGATGGTGGQGGAGGQGGKGGQGGYAVEARELNLESAVLAVNGNGGAGGQGGQGGQGGKGGQGQYVYNFFDCVGGNGGSGGVGNVGGNGGDGGDTYSKISCETISGDATFLTQRAGVVGVAGNGGLGGSGGEGGNAGRGATGAGGVGGNWGAVGANRLSEIASSGNAGNAGKIADEVVSNE